MKVERKSSILLHSLTQICAGTGQYKEHFDCVQHCEKEEEKTTAVEK